MKKASMLFGAGGAKVQISDADVQKFGNGTGTVTASYSVNADGKIRNQNGNVLETWLPTGLTNTDYEVIASFSGGDSITGTFGSAITLGTNVIWSISATAPLTKQGIMQVSLRDVATHTVQDTATISLTAENTP